MKRSESLPPLLSPLALSAESSADTIASRNRRRKERISGMLGRRDAEFSHVCLPPREFQRHPSAIPFHIPHRNMLTKYEAPQAELPEPLYGFAESQRKLLRSSLARRRDRISEDTTAERGSQLLPYTPYAHPIDETFDEVEIVLPHYKIVDVVDQTKLISKLRAGEVEGFVYLIFAVPRSSEHYTPYALRLVPYDQIDAKYFITMSSHGVLQCVNGEQTFTSLNKWEMEYNMYRYLMRYKTFFNFRKWKAFYVWRKIISFDKFHSAGEHLRDNLFILNPLLRCAVLNIRMMIHKLIYGSFTNVNFIENQHLFYFNEYQLEKKDNMAANLKSFRSLAAEIVSNACHGALLEKGFIVDETIAEQQPRRRDKKAKTSYIEQANKKKYSMRLCCFIIFVDYIVVDMLHKIIMNSYDELIWALEQHIPFMPSEEKIEKLDSFSFDITRPETSYQLPLFIIDVFIKPRSIYPWPNYEIVSKVFRDLEEYWKEVVIGIKPLIGDKAYNAFTQPIINGKQEDRLCGFGPPLEFFIGANPTLRAARVKMFAYLKRNYEIADAFLMKLDQIGKFFTEDYKVEEMTINEERDLEVFRGWCQRYNLEIEIIKSVSDWQPLGILHMQMIDFKELAIPQPTRLLDIIMRVLPRIGSEKVQYLIEAVDYANAFLGNEPVATMEFVTYLEFIDAATAKLDNLDAILDYCKELYAITDDFKIEVPPAEMEDYLGLSLTMGTLRNLVDKKIEERDKIIATFNKEMNKDISALIEEIGEIKENCMEPWLYDKQSNVEQVTMYLSHMYEHLMECLRRANEFKSYQKQFRLEVTRFDMLEEVLNDVKLRILLWESVDGWAQQLKEWYETDFSALNVDNMNLFTTKTMKNITQLEKGLPKNLVVPELKESVEVVKDKLPVITYLRNPALRTRHWMAIENLLNYKFRGDESTTLTLLESLKVFSFPDELMEISGQASSEFSLENLLKKVEENWKTLEFPVNAHRGAKDVYILGSLEDVQAILDDSNINITTIASSRHVGPIKPRVDEWVRILDLFAKIIDEWQMCQQNWIYLEVIFSAPDIQRQLPNETKMFLIVDKSFKEIMRQTAKMPLCMEAVNYPNLLETFKKNNELLEQIMKCLESYLETKRVAFPRFYFLSNDELLDILAQTRNPHAVQPHLRKCFDAIAKLEFGVKTQTEDEKGEIVETTTPILTTDIVAMISPEGERVALGKGLKARGNVEDWLGKVEESMFLSLRKCMKSSMYDYMSREREKWCLSHPSQVVLTVSQIMWARQVHAIFDFSKDKRADMKLFEAKNIADLNKLAGLVRTDLNKITRRVLIALITIDVHARDNISNMVKANVTSSQSFEWLKMLRYYWIEAIDNCAAKMSSASHIYGYEYLGAAGVLVITPLTDKCYLCLMGALQLDLGGAPAGPAGTGKTETTKDLAKSLAIQCVVFNCSEGLDYKMMGRFFSGLAQSGAWCCFDEFNRIDIEVLSVIAQQLITIRNAKASKLTRFMFEGREIKLVHQCAAFITMNPGYAGRTELPDNLKALFRPISMMVPDYALIAEVTLYSEGFESSKVLSYKMVQMYKLCSEQLSQQDHYDFGMRAVKSVLVMAGSLKRASPDRNEDIVLICALRDSNLPKFLSDDAILFNGILTDLFPGIELPINDYGNFETTIIGCMVDNNLQPEPTMIRKVIQLHETMIVRWGVMLVGPTGAGKSAVLDTLGRALQKMHELGEVGPYWQPVHKYVMNPKAVTAGELYGEVNPFTLEWRDGLMGIMVRTAVNTTEEDHQWVICDGPVDAVWIENLNTVLDDNKMLCLANSERIKLTPYVHMVFEVQDLAQASPATVSRCGMVYIDPDELKWLPYVKSWLATQNEAVLTSEYKDFILEMFERAVEDGFVYIRKHCVSIIHQVDIAKVTMMCAILQEIISVTRMDRIGEKARVRNYVCQAFIYAYLWGLGSNLDDYCKEKFESYVHDQFDEYANARLPPGVDLWTVYVDSEEHKYQTWNNIVPNFAYNPELPFFDMLVPTIDTVRCGYIMEQLIKVNYPVFFTGGTGVGKSVVARQVLSKMQATGLFVPITLNFSAQTSSMRVQEILELKLEKRKKTLLGAPIGKRVVLFVDDVNMPKLETYGAQPPIELLRLFLDHEGLYDREKLFWKEIKDVVLAVACAPPGGGRNPLTPRFVRHFGMVVLPQPNENALKVIFKAILKGFLFDFANPVRDLADNMVSASVEIYNRIAEDLLPTPAKSHYVFNLRDLSKCIQGMLQADSGIIREERGMLRLFYHECLRVFHDRLINNEDKVYFYFLMKELCNRYFGTPVMDFTNESIVKQPPILIFGDFMSFGAAADDRIYEEIVSMDKLKNILTDYLEDFNLVTQKEMTVIFFMDAVEHCTRIARVLRSDRGNGLLVGVGGMGKQSLTKLASHLNGYTCHQIELTRNYDHTSFFEDLRIVAFKAGALFQHTVFLFTDTQIVQEEFLEDINNLLNSGEVPNLFEADELEKVIIATRPQAQAAGISEASREGIYEFFVNRVRNRLHLVLCMSPVGDAFRRRCRMFPSLVNCCTIDWFVKWPNEALLTVANRAMASITNDQQLQTNLSTICVNIHESVERMTERFYNEMRRHYYTTPSSYLELLKLYSTMLTRKNDQLTKQKQRIENGLEKLYETNSVIDSMKETLQAMEPQLKQKSTAVKNLLEFLTREQKAADKVRIVVKADEVKAKEQAEETQILADDAQRDLSTALPAMEAAMKALESLNKSDINEIRVFQKPPNLVRFVMEAVCLLLGAKPDWASAKQVMGDGNFLKRLQDFDKNNISEKTLFKLKAYVENKEFMPDIVAAVSKVCKSMCMWVRAIDMYAKVYKIVEPKRKKLEAAEEELNNVMGVLRDKQRQLADVEGQIANLQGQYESSIAEKEALEANMGLTTIRLQRAGRLNIALADEQIRWEESIKLFGNQFEKTIGDVLISAAAVAYLGVFTSTYRKELMDNWVTACHDLQIPISSNFSIITVLADPYDIRHWNSCGLPRDTVSTENAILVTQANRWPLSIDPQEQAYRWIKQMETPNELRIVKQTDGGLLRTLENAIRLGCPVLLEEIGEQLDPTLTPILNRQTFVQGGRVLIRLGDSDVEYDNNFKFYITTKLSNPHYLPEVCIQVTLVNFTVTPSGLEDQLLADCVRLERPDLETLRTDLLTRINSDKMQLKLIEDKILRMLFQSEGNILDDEELIDTLNESKETSAIIAARLIETETTEQSISIAREKYRTVATRGSILYFVVAQLAEIDPMYQYSLKYFNQIFNTVIETSERSGNLEVRLNTLYTEITLAVYTNISRGLFERHKLVFSFMLCVAIRLEANLLKENQFSFVIRGPMGTRTLPEKKPDIPTMTDLMWLSVHYLQHEFENFARITEECTRRIYVQVGRFEHELTIIPNNPRASTVNWNAILDDFEKLMLIKVMQEEKLVFAITEFVKLKLGQAFIESPAISLPVLYADTSCTIPLIFVLSTGSDPFGAFQRFAAEMSMTERVQSISLGQGQGPVAEKLIELGKTKGDWVFLQNCHLATSWMLAMERIILKIAESESNHPSFRLFLSSMPSKTFPVSVLQNSVKVTNEPPKGLRANVKRALIDMQESFFEGHQLENQWTSMIFGICMFHAIVQERKKFGPLGWNIVYEFNDSDRDFAFNTLRMFCEHGTIPWDALDYITGEITYGGRVTDHWDLRCLKTILRGFFSPASIAPNYAYSESGVYYCPTFITLREFRTFVDQLPIIEEPEIFGMHENANIAFQIKETQGIVKTILDCQPRVGDVAGAQSADSIVFNLAQYVIETIVTKINVDEAHPKLFIRDDRDRIPSFTTVLLQEVDRFNALLKLIHSSMEVLQKAIKGLVLMSEQLEGVYNAFITNRVPEMWTAKCYPSMKSLGTWIRDLELRLDFITVWMRSGAPMSFWISGFYFPQGFLTGALQRHARRHNLPIDLLKFDFIARPIMFEQELIKTAHDANSGKEDFSVYGDLQRPEDGVHVHGLFVDAGRFDIRQMLLVDAKPGEINPPYPVMTLVPTTVMPKNDTRYVCPLYKTSLRAGVLSTTGHSTNFVIAVLVPTQQLQSYWILKGTALLTQLTD